MTQIKKFEPKTVRTDVLKQLETIQTNKFIELPANYKESTFFALDKLASLPGIDNVPAEGITKAMIDMFSNKLDYRKNHLYFFVQNDKNSPTGKSLRFGWQYQGLIHVAKQTAGVVDVTPVLVHEGDTFKTHYEWGALIIDEHIPTFEGDITGGYCVVLFEDTRYMVKYYPKAELDKRRDKSQAKDGSFWAWEREMYEKTLINATLKRLIETSSDSEVDTDSLYAEAPESTSGREVIDAEIIQQGEPTEVAQPQQLNEAPQAENGTFKMG